MEKLPHIFIFLKARVSELTLTNDSATRGWRRVTRGRREVARGDKEREMVGEVGGIGGGGKGRRDNESQGLSTSIYTSVKNLPKSKV